MKKVLIQPRSSWTFLDLIEIVEFRWVLMMLIIRDIKLRYKQTVLGIVWVVMQPLMTSILLTCVFGRWLHVSSDGVPYMLFSFCGLIPWLVFSQSANRAGTSLVNETQLIKKIYFPRIFLPISGTLGVIIDYLCSLATLAILMVFYQYPLTWNIFFIPIATLFLMIFSCAFNIFMSSLSAHYRDFKHLLPFLLQFWMYASPLAYSMSSVPEKWHWLFALNPLSGIIDAYRWALLGYGSFPVFTFTVMGITTVIFLWLSLLLFRKLERTLADVL